MGKNNGYRIVIGEPERVVSGDRARDLLTNRLLYSPGKGGGIGKDSLGANAEVINKLGLDMDPTTARRDDVARGAADAVISRLEGNTGKFDKFTVESIAMLDENMFNELLEASSENIVSADNIDTAIESLPRSNGKTFTTIQALRTAEQILDPEEFEKQFEYSNSKDARVPASWYNYEKAGVLNDNNNGMKIIKPRGMEYYKNLMAEDRQVPTPFTSLSDAQQDAVLNIYEDNPKALSDILQTHAEAAEVVAETKGIQSEFSQEENDAQIEEIFGAGLSDLNEKVAGQDAGLNK